MDMTKRSVKELLAIKTDAELAEFFDTSRQAVFAWGEDKPIPEGRQWQLRAKRPDLFPTTTTAAA